jgi:hypothetical protein
MRVAVVHLTDIHFRISGNPVLAALDTLAHAVSSVDASVSLFLIVISGDIAFSGKPAEYRIALKFFRDLTKQLKALQPGARVELVSVPGNHDCLLPEGEVKLRETLVQGFIPSVQEGDPDPGLLRQLLKAQAPYNLFRQRLQHTTWNGLCETMTIAHEDKNIQLNLYNTALLSQRHERQGQLHVPVATFGEEIKLHSPSVLSISVFHHSFIWLDSNIAISFRFHIENTSDIALSGHQHYGHAFTKENTTGERVVYVEGAALQDENYAKSSRFRVLLFDWATESEKVIGFNRRGDSYRRESEDEWKPLTLNRAVRPAFRFSKAFDEALNKHGIPLLHSVKGHLGLRDIFVFPTLAVTPSGVKARQRPREIKGEEIIGYAQTAKRILFQAPGLGGKTALAHMLVWELFRRGNGIPLLLKGPSIRSAEEAALLTDLWHAFSLEYDPRMLDAFRQLPRTERILIIDDWHKTDLNPDGRSAFLNLAGQHFERIFLFTGELFQIQQLMDKSTDIMVDFDRAMVSEWGHALRGSLIDRWVNLGREHTGSAREINRTIEEKERLIQDMIGKNTLPSLPFIVLALLQADEIDKAESAEAGSFGYLYDVLVTVALSATKGPKAQLEKKYVFLAILAYRMFKLKTKTLPLSHVREIAQEYAKSHFVAVDIDSMLDDLEEARVFVNVDGNYGFGYSHLLYYFIARYYRDNLDRDATLMPEIMTMVDEVSADESASILTFIVFFARHSQEIVGKLVANADRIYPNSPPASLESDVLFLNRLEEAPIITIPDDDVDIVKVRKGRRELSDRLSKSVEPTSESRHIVYDDNLSDRDKFALATRHIDLLGQIIRNFPASLPGEDKLDILRSAYLLGLRLLGELLRILQAAVEQFRDRAKQMNAEQGLELDEKAARRLADMFVMLLSRMATLTTIKRVSLGVGVADLAEAYKEVLKRVGLSYATELIDISVKLDHFDEFPEYDIRALHKKMSANPFADSILADLVAAYMMMFDLDRRTRQSMSSLFRLNPNTPGFIDPKGKRLVGS